MTTKTLKFSSNFNTVNASAYDTSGQWFESHSRLNLFNLVVWKLLYYTSKNEEIKTINSLKYVNDSCKISCKLLHL